MRSKDDSDGDGGLVSVPLDLLIQVELASVFDYSPSMQGEAVANAVLFGWHSAPAYNAEVELRLRWTGRRPSLKCQQSSLLSGPEGTKTWSTRVRPESLAATLTSALAGM